MLRIVGLNRKIFLFLIALLQVIFFLFVYGGKYTSASYQDLKKTLTTTLIPNYYNYEEISTSLKTLFPEERIIHSFVHDIVCSTHLLLQSPHIHTRPNTPTPYAAHSHTPRSTPPFYCELKGVYKVNLEKGTCLYSMIHSRAYMKVGELHPTGLTIILSSTITLKEKLLVIHHLSYMKQGMKTQEF